MPTELPRGPLYVEKALNMCYYNDVKHQICANLAFKKTGLQDVFSALNFSSSITEPLGILVDSQVHVSTACRAGLMG